MLFRPTHRFTLESPRLRLRDVQRTLTYASAQGAKDSGDATVPDQNAQKQHEPVRNQPRQAAILESEYDLIRKNLETLAEHVEASKSRHLNGFGGCSYQSASARIDEVTAALQRISLALTLLSDWGSHNYSEVYL